MGLSSCGSFSCCGAWPQLSRDMWHLPRPVIKSLHCQVDSQLLEHQGSPFRLILRKNLSKQLCLVILKSSKTWELIGKFYAKCMGKDMRVMRNKLPSSIFVSNIFCGIFQKLQFVLQKMSLYLRATPSCLGWLTNVPSPCLSISQMCFFASHWRSNLSLSSQFIVDCVILFMMFLLLVVFLVPCNSDSGSLIFLYLW